MDLGKFLLIETATFIVLGIINLKLVVLAAALLLACTVANLSYFAYENIEDGILNF
jgi:hypothetical protein